MSYVQYLHGLIAMEPVKALVALLASPLMCTTNLVKQAMSALAVQLPLQLAMLPSAKQHAITAWLRVAQPDDRLVVRISISWCYHLNSEFKW